jgi:tetratricopeptide (TPR) repeat protein
MSRRSKLSDCTTNGVACRVCRRACAVAIVLFCHVAGCETENQEKFRQYNSDGIDLFSKGSYTQALEDFQFASQLGPADANLEFNIGQCYDRLSQTDKAESYYRQCLGANGNHAECRHALAAVLYRTGRANEADNMIQDWLTAEPKLGAAYAEDGWRLHRSGDYQNAIGRCQQALHYDPHNVRALVQIGMIYEDQERPDLSLAMYARALEYDPQNRDLKANINRLKAKGIGKALPD